MKNTRIVPAVALFAIASMMTATSATAVETTPSPYSATVPGVGAQKITYSVPDGARVIHVDVSTTSQAQNGTVDNPFNSIQRAVWNANAGDYIVVESGHYHEYVGIFNDADRNGDGVLDNRDNITIQPAPGANVVMDGTADITDWTDNGDGTWSATYTHNDGFNTLASRGDTVPTGNLAFTDSVNPLANDSSQVFFNNVLLKQVSGIPGIGQFTVEHDIPTLLNGSAAPAHTTKVTISQDPTSAVVAVSQKRQAVESNVNGLTIQGISVIGYANPLNYQAVLYSFGGSNMTVRNMTFYDTPNTSVDASDTPGSLFENNTFIRPGLNAIGLHTNDNTTIKGNLIVEANSELFRPAPVGSAIKVTSSRNLDIIGNEIMETKRATGIWIDESVIDFNIDNNVVKNSGSNGIQAEISACGIIDDNIINGASKGIEVLSTPNVWVVNNTVSNVSGEANVAVMMDGRRQTDGGMGVDPRDTSPSAINTWVTTNTHIIANELSGGTTAQGYFDIHDRQGQSYSDEMITLTDFNILKDNGSTIGRFGVEQTYFDTSAGVDKHSTRVYPDMDAVAAAHGSTFWGVDNIMSNTATMQDVELTLDCSTAVATPTYTKYPVTLQEVSPTQEPTSPVDTTPTDSPTTNPVVDPAPAPTDTPTSEPVVDPTDPPVSDPVVDPTGEPTDNATTDPTTDPVVEGDIPPVSDPKVDVPTTDDSTAGNPDGTNNTDPTGNNPVDTIVDNPVDNGNNGNIPVDNSGPEKETTPDSDADVPADIPVNEGTDEVPNSGGAVNVPESTNDGKVLDQNGGSVPDPVVASGSGLGGGTTSVSNIPSVQDDSSLSGGSVPGQRSTVLASTGTNADVVISLSALLILIGFALTFARNSKKHNN